MVWMAALFACFVWWFSTGALLLIVRRADRAGGAAHTRAACMAVPMAAAGAVGITMLDALSPVAAAYGGFVAALAIWGAIELTFLTGAVTGPNRKACPVGATPMGRLTAAWTAIYWHELLIVAGLLLIVVLTSGDIAHVATATYLVLFLARICAKLNLFFGVPRINIEFVPTSLAHITSYFRQGPVTIAFPLAISFLTFATACFIFQIAQAETAGVAATYSLLTAIAALALLEHWLMVLPLPDAALWRWMLPKPTQGPPVPEVTER
jgi:putative photosynthetic complex assembly protein 2